MTGQVEPFKFGDRYYVDPWVESELRKVQMPRPLPPPVQIDNLIQQTNANGFLSEPKSKEDEKLLKRIKEMKNCSIVYYGENKQYRRFRFQKTQNGKKHEFAESDPKIFLERVAEMRKMLKQNIDITIIKPKQKFKYILYDECRNYVELYKGDNDDDGKHKRKLLGVCENHLKCLTKDIREYTQDDMQKFRNGLSDYKKVDKQCMLILKPVLENAVLNRLIPMSPLTNTKSKAQKSEKREWIHISDQRTILDNLFDKKKCKIGDELLFYFLTGCRREEAFLTTINWDKGIVFINGTKSGNADRYIRLSPKAVAYFKPRWENMFRYKEHYYSKNTTPFLKSLGICDKSLHSIRHSFSTNIFYLEVTEDQHQYSMGHHDIAFTKKIYTKYDPTVDKCDIIDVWSDWYPADFVLKSVLNNVA